MEASLSHTSPNTVYTREEHFNRVPVAESRIQALGNEIDTLRENLHLTLIRNELLEDKYVVLQTSVSTYTQQLARNRSQIVRGVNHMRAIKNTKIQRLELGVAQITQTAQKQPANKRDVGEDCGECAIDSLELKELNSQDSVTKMNESQHTLGAKSGSIPIGRPSERSGLPIDGTTVGIHTAEPGSGESCESLEDHRQSLMRACSECTQCMQKNAIIQDLQRKLQYVQDRVTVYVRPPRDETMEYLMMLAKQQRLYSVGSRFDTTAICEVLVGVGMGWFCAMQTI
ncbi:hypothetical protein SARC_09401 [Sphaeroforma arctica JP610]|uniref:Uncharacterized protein n=1 Tax=Sphaeroforma arctica JP610 TaxID=667725 RepID=A0A0L0FN18_9EUKA|nr:hypothetical protein SARC_09401 [Sphaeroforma arctica JP610]KNC78157.1 hypothetical protein SARC_09401 [Sphaeroforma arctica JP610]|eukprot:XP_014152059.1 hypothetical protein SARC_09401 [Sphaeroforma arctica JP610]